MSETNLSSDRHFDLLLRLLTLFVLFSLACCVAFLGHNYWASHMRRTDEDRGLRAADPQPPPAPAAAVKPAPPDEVLMDPRKTFRCVENGRVSFSDRACEGSDAEVLPLTPAPGNAATGAPRNPPAARAAPPAPAAPPRGPQ